MAAKLDPCYLHRIDHHSSISPPPLPSPLSSYPPQMQVGARRAFSTAMKTLIAIGQMTSTGDRTRNLEVCGQLVQQAKQRSVSA